MGEISGDHTVEVVTDAMLDKLISQFNHVAVLFYDKEDEDSIEILAALVISFSMVEEVVSRYLPKLPHLCKNKWNLDAVCSLCLTAIVWRLGWISF